MPRQTIEATKYAESMLGQVEDLMQMQACNLMNLPENYNQKYCAS